MALELVYWAEGVRRPSPQTPPGQGRVVVVVFAAFACVGAESRPVPELVPRVGLCWGF
jgi:hypothetical protein